MACKSPPLSWTKPVTIGTSISSEANEAFASVVYKCRNACTIYATISRTDKEYLRALFNMPVEPDLMVSLWFHRARRMALQTRKHKNKVFRRGALPNVYNKFHPNPQQDIILFNAEIVQCNSHGFGRLEWLASSRGVFVQCMSKIWYPLNVSRQSALRSPDAIPQVLICSSWLGRNILSLGSHPEMFEPRRGKTELPSGLDVKGWFAVFLDLVLVANWSFSRMMLNVSMPWIMEPLSIHDEMICFVYYFSLSAHPHSWDIYSSLDLRSIQYACGICDVLEHIRSRL